MAKASFSIAGVDAAPGQRAARVLDLSFAGAPIKLPLFVLNGAHEGRTLLVTAGIHGAEYVGIEAAYRLARQTEPGTLHGRPVAVQINVEAYFHLY